MKTRRRYWMLATLVVMAGLLSVQPSSPQQSDTQCQGLACEQDQCTVVVVGKKASTDG